MGRAGTAVTAAWGATTASSGDLKGPDLSVSGAFPVIPHHQGGGISLVFANAPCHLERQEEAG